MLSYQSYTAFTGDCQHDAVYIHNLVDIGPRRALPCDRYELPFDNHSTQG